MCKRLCWHFEMFRKSFDSKLYFENDNADKWRGNQPPAALQRAPKLTKFLASSGSKSDITLLPHSDVLFIEQSGPLNGGSPISLYRQSV